MPRPLTKKESLYWGLWSEYKKFLVEEKGWDAKRANAFRHEFIRRIFGYAISSKDFQHRHLDHLKTVVKAHTDPDNIELQIAQQGQALKRAQTAVWNLSKKLGLSQAYLEAMSQRICKSSLAEATEPQLAKLLAALHIHARRKP